jgi:tetratricopeptide (TPR) repeat protein
MTDFKKGLGGVRNGDGNGPDQSAGNGPRDGSGNDPRNEQQWAAVEEATELLHEERFREALVELRRVLAADPQNPYAFNFLGVAFFEVGELEAARDAYAACLKLAPAYLGARVALSQVLRSLSDARGAVREGQAALSQSPGDPDALYAVGLAYRARGDDAAATKYLEAFLATGPEFEVAVETRALLSAIARENGEEEETEEDDD